MSHPIRRVIVGTAGHIDHGKSTLVRALTGVDPDRLAEEKQRGMTIDLGFAPYETASGRTVGIIDVPGHERFVRNMVAGASSVDLFLLVVAADDGVMPQTREHVDILSLLGAREGVVALTKIDTVEPDFVELARIDVEEFLSRTGFAQAPVIPVSAVTGEGLDRLRAELDRRIERVEERAGGGPFRMPIQRVFSKPGHGTVVTGVPVSGSVRVGDVLEILPPGVRGRVRGIQAYRETREAAAAGHSTALNLADVDTAAVRRGHVVCAPDLFEPVRFLEVEMRTVEGARTLRHGEMVRLHVGTAEVPARLALLDRDRVEPGEEVLAQLRLREPVVARHGDRFLVRLLTPPLTVGGGRIVSVSARRRAKPRAVLAQETRRLGRALDEPGAWLEEVLAQRAPLVVGTADAARLVLLTPEESGALLEELAAGGRVVKLGKGRFAHADRWRLALERAERALDRLHDEQPLRAWVDAGLLKRRLGPESAWLDELLAQLAVQGRIESRKGGGVRISGRTPRLDPQTRRSVDRLLEELETSGARPPSPAELSDRVGLPPARTVELLDLLAEEGRAFRCGEHYFSASVRERLLEVVGAVAEEHGGEVVVPEVRDRLGTTRKYLIPLLERLDAEGYTVRRGEKRFLVSSRLEERR